MLQTKVLNEFLKRPIAYQPVLAKAFDSVKLGIFWSQLYYWSDKTRDPEGWIYKTREEIYEETALSRKEQETARKLGIQLGVLEEKLAGHPATVHFRINPEQAYTIVEKFIAEKYKGQMPLNKDWGKKINMTGSIAYVKAIPAEDVKELADKYTVTEKFVRERAADVLDYCEAKGKKYSNYKAALRNFIKMHLERHPEIVSSMVANERSRQEREQRELETAKAQNRTPDEQARIDARLAEIRQNLSRKFTPKQ